MGKAKNETGYVTVTPNLNFEVSRRIREEFENGRHYYALHGKRIAAPEQLNERPDPGALASKESWSYPQYLLALSELEVADRRERRIQRLRRTSKLPWDKSLTALDRSRLPQSVDRQLSVLVEGDFLDRAENLLVFGNSGSGKTHLVCALGQELILQNRRVLFSTCALLVQRLLRAKIELTLEKELKKLDRFEALIIDDIGYVQQNRQEMEILFTLLSHRYERRSILLTSNLVFSN